MFQTLLDLLSLSQHTRYFSQTRSHHVYRRVRLLLLLLALTQAAWVSVDSLLLPVQMQTPIELGRLLSAAALLALLLWCRQPYRLGFSLARLGLMLAILSAFQVYSNVLLIQAGYVNSVAGYQFFPFMIVSMQAIFPLTLAEVAIITGSMLLIELLTQLAVGQLGDVARLNDLWLLLVLGVIAGWASVNQLGMLLGLYRQATRDVLTGLANRRQAMELLEGDVKQCLESGEPLSVLLFDLDRFKHFNDTHGHAAGDVVLKQFARILRRQVKGKRDLASRFGGEEFLVILPGSGTQGAATLAEAIVNDCHLSPVQTPSGERVGFTTSIGVASLESGESVAALLQRADEALYQAKHNGRDGYVVAGHRPSERPEASDVRELQETETAGVL